MRNLFWVLVCVGLLPACRQNKAAAPDKSITGVGESGARRLSRNEYDNTLRDLLRDESRSGYSKLPEDVNDPFDNDYLTQETSAVLVEAAETVATEAADRLLADPAKRDQVVGCTPSGVPDEDAACLRSFVVHFGRLALRRPLRSDEIERYLAFDDFAAEGGDFYIAVKLVIRSMLQNPEFLYRVEIGKPVQGRPGLFRLTDWEVATRLSFFLWGSTPDDALLDLAAAGKLSTPEDIRTAALRLFDDSRARARVDRFHALWLGYHQLPHAAALTASMRTETAALVERIVFDEDRPWTDLFTSPETYVDANLAAIYGMPAPASGFAWEPYAGPGERAGILSHGSFLSVAGKFGDTSPTQRGKLIRERLLCTPIPPPPPEVNVDEPPTSQTSNCKFDQYEEHRSSGSCSSCHTQMDPVGFGLENFDQTGKWRAHDNGEPDCLIAGDGELFGAGENGVILFNGPAELGSALLESGDIESCLIKQVFRFAAGRREQAEDWPFIDALASSFSESHRFEQLLLDVVTAKQFGYRQEEE
jgi:hypothetical protein